MAGSCPDGDDLFQEAVIRALGKLAQLRDPARFPAWFYAVMLSVHRSRARRGFWRRFVGLDAEHAPRREPIAGGATIDEEALRSRRLSSALARLPAVQREAIVLHDLDGYRMEEIAEMQRVTVSAVKSRVSRGRVARRRHYERLGFGSGAAPAAAPGVTAGEEWANG